MLGTIRTIQHQAGQALPTCAQSNHSLMNTFGAVCSKLLPVGARATGNRPTLPSHRSPPPHLQRNSFLDRPSLLIFAPAVRPSTHALNQIKIQICALSIPAQLRGGCSENISWVWAAGRRRRRGGRYASIAEVFTVCAET